MRILLVFTGGKYRIETEALLDKAGKVIYIGMENIADTFGLNLDGLVYVIYCSYRLVLFVVFYSQSNIREPDGSLTKLRYYSITGWT